MSVHFYTWMVGLVDSRRQTFWENFSWQVYLLSEFFTEICWLEIAMKYFFSYFVLMPDMTYEPGGFMSNKPTQKILGDFSYYPLHIMNTFSPPILMIWINLIVKSFIPHCPVISFPKYVLPHTERYEKKSNKIRNN